MDIKIVEYSNNFYHTVVRESQSFSNAQKAAHFRDNSDFAGKYTKLEYDYESEFRGKANSSHCSTGDALDYSLPMFFEDGVKSDSRPQNKYHVFWEGWITLALLAIAIFWVLKQIAMGNL